MPFSTNISKRFRQAFVCAPSQIESICNILRTRIAPSIEISTTLSDGTTRRFASEADLFKFNNPRSRRMIELELTSTNRGDSYSRIAVEFDKQASLRTISIIGEAADEIIVVVRQEISEIIESTKPTYSAVAIRHLGVSFVVGITTWFGISVYLFATIAGKFKDGQKLSVSAAHIAEIIILGVAWLASMFATISLFEKAIMWIFPQGVFLIGDEKSEYALLEKRKSLLGVGILLAFVVSIIANYFSRGF
jgi:hypothetical protein